MPKKFSNNNPLENLSRTIKNSETQEPEPIQSSSKTAFIQTKRKPKYLRLDITDYRDYVSLMTDHLKITSGKYVSMTQYILQLIEADKQQNLELYQKLEQIENMKRNIT